MEEIFTVRISLHSIARSAQIYSCLKTCQAVFYSSAFGGVRGPLQESPIVIWVCVCLTIDCVNLASYESVNSNFIFTPVLYV